MPKLLRKGAGQPIRDAMARAGLSGPELAVATKAIDPRGRGVSASTVGRIAGRGKTARDTCELTTAWVIAEALHRRTNAPLQDLFAIPALSTVTAERSTPDADEG
jgi:hypothetical protein